MFLFSDGLLFHTGSVTFCYLLLTCVYAQHEVLHLIFVVEITHTVSLRKCWWGRGLLLSFLPVLFGTWSFHTASTPSYLGWCHYSSTIILLWIYCDSCDCAMWFGLGFWEDCQIWRDCVNVGALRNHWMLCGSMDFGLLKGNRVECCAALWTLAYGVDLCECFHNEAEWYWVLFITGPVVNLVVSMSFGSIVLYPLPP